MHAMYVYRAYAPVYRYACMYYCMYTGHMRLYVGMSNAARRYDDGCHVSRPLLLVACTFMAQDADVTTACSSAVSTHVGVL